MGGTNNHSQFQPKLTHLFRLLDENGILQHSHLSDPDPSLGYSIDDNARGLVTFSLLEKHLPHLKHQKAIKTLFSFIESQKGDEGGFRNYLYINQEGEFLSREEAGDGLGQVIWACGYHNYLFPRSTHTALATSLIDFALLEIEEKNSLRCLSYALAGLSYQYRFKPHEKYQAAASRIAQKLISLYQDNSNPNWQWFEKWLVYGNAILPWSLLVASRMLSKPSFGKLGRTSLDFLNEQTTLGRLALPVGQGRWYEQGKVRSVFDQQPIEAAYS
ncbi:hypothetical protein MUP65_01020, partial [Patescibacteria group bacterium]|nr:hypothetical protein [Patescibacteria group bacterium]